MRGTLSRERGTPDMSNSPIRCLIAGAMLAVACPAAAQPAPPNNAPDATLRSTPETVVWGYFAADIAPALRIKSGQTVRVDTVSHGGVNTGVDPVTFFSRHGVAAGEVLKDAIDIYEKVSRPRGASAHILTGPIYVEEAEPGDMLEVRILALEYRVPYGVNNSNRGTGVLPDLLSAATPKVIRFDTVRNVALFSPDIEVPLQPFMGIMAVAPSREAWLISSRPPSRWGGNMDFNKLTNGATLYLPVFHKGAQFFTGDSHAVQADGEINGTAIEASLTGTFQFIVHKGAGGAMTWPRAEDANYYCATGKAFRPPMPMRSPASRSISAWRKRLMRCRWCTGRSRRRFSRAIRSIGRASERHESASKPCPILRCRPRELKKWPPLIAKLGVKAE